MGIQERKEREKDARRKLIMRCAKELLLEHGSERVSMIDIAKRAEISKGTLYLYFPTKEELYKRICDEAANRFIAHFQSQFTSNNRENPSALETIKLFWRCYLDMFGESEDMIIIFTMKNYIAPAFPFSPFDNPASEPESPYIFYTMIRDMIQQGIHEGAFDPSINPGMVAKTMLSMFSHIMGSVVNMPKAERKPALIIGEVKHIFEIILRGIAREHFDRAAFTLPG
ncbi:MAG: TetR/AcrR family transcriptional regulator [Spirochaetaceae bacterium]|jgi:AcrR family transcriptional regulator|nr:TetR/AcrR family transcriptional regulator [Spirochaetaceae bacterium]